MEKVIAERKLLYSVKESAIRKELTIRVGVPYVNDEGMARCRRRAGNRRNRGQRNRGQNTIAANISGNCVLTLRF